MHNVLSGVPHATVVQVLILQLQCICVSGATQKALEPRATSTRHMPVTWLRRLHTVSSSNTL